MLVAAELIKEARRSAGLTQAELAERMQTTQSVIARLESGRANPRFDTVLRAIAATGQELEARLRPARTAVDESLIAANLRLEPGERLRRFHAAYSSVRDLAARAGRREPGNGL